MEHIEIASQSPNGFEVTKNIYYGTDFNGDSQDGKYGLNCDKISLDLYLPTTKPRNDGKKFPFVVFIHGGGWRRGDRTAWKYLLCCKDTNIFLAVVTWFFNLYGNVGECLASSGIACAVISYPLARLGLLQMLMEMCSSFIIGSLVCSVISSLCLIPVLASTVLVLPKLTFLSPFLMGVLGYNNLLFTLMTIRRSDYRLKLWEILTVIPTYLLAGFILYMSCKSTRSFMCCICLVSTVISQTVMFVKRFSLPNATIQDQICSIQKVIDWSRKYIRSHETISDLYLMGHSAGGHLATLVSFMDKELVTDDSMKIQIKGVISISGVYDPTKLSKPLMKSFYLLPAFGEKKLDWQEASPVYQAKTVSTVGLPLYLLINAEKDLHLHQDTEDLSYIFDTRGIQHHQLLIPNTTHFTIMNLFSRQIQNNVLVPNILNFINNSRSQ